MWRVINWESHGKVIWSRLGKDKATTSSGYRRSRLAAHATFGGKVWRSVLKGLGHLLGVLFSGVRGCVHVQERTKTNLHAAEFQGCVCVRN